eukprot:NODE_250_length_11764_cov_1.155594.p2 type:complete len:173 gc:universal NODE_250_length_11764_cov_1.155594:8844-9362(+)
MTPNSQYNYLLHHYNIDYQEDVMARLNSYWAFKNVLLWDFNLHTPTELIFLLEKETKAIYHLLPFRTVVNQITYEYNNIIAAIHILLPQLKGISNPMFQAKVVDHCLRLEKHFLKSLDSPPSILHRLTPSVTLPINIQQSPDAAPLIFESMTHTKLQEILLVIKLRYGISEG